MECSDKTKAIKPKKEWTSRKPGFLPECANCPYRVVSKKHPELGCDTYYEGNDLCPYVLMDLYDDYRYY